MKRNNRDHELTGDWVGHSDLFGKYFYRHRR